MTKCPLENTYLSDSLCTYQTSSTLRSSNEKLLKIPKRSLKSVGGRFFSFIAPTVWNLLPASLRNLQILSDFKAQLKSVLFQQTFPQIQADHDVCVCVARGKLCLCLSVYLREWCVLAHRDFLTGRFALYKSHPLLLLLSITRLPRPLKLHDCPGLSNHITSLPVSRFDACPVQSRDRVFQSQTAL